MILDQTPHPGVSLLIRAWRTRRNLTRTDLARASGVKLRTIVAWESGVRACPIAKLRHLAQVLDIPAMEVGLAVLEGPD